MVAPWLYRRLQYILRDLIDTANYLIVVVDGLKHNDLELASKIERKIYGVLAEAEELLRQLQQWDAYDEVCYDEFFSRAERLVSGLRWVLRHIIRLLNA